MMEQIFLNVIGFGVMLLRPLIQLYVRGCELALGDTRACTWFVVVTVPFSIVIGYVLVFRAIALFLYRSVLRKRIEQYRRCQVRIARGKKKRMVLRAIRGAGLTPASGRGQQVLSYYFGP